MNELLLSELTSNDQDLLQTLVLLEEYILSPSLGAEPQPKSQSLMQPVPHLTHTSEFDPEINKEDLPDKSSEENNNLDALESIIEACQSALAEVETPLEKAELLINELYFRHLFIDSYQQHWPLSAFKVSESLNFRVMSPVIKAAFIVEITEACGFESDIVFVLPGPHSCLQI